MRKEIKDAALEVDDRRFTLRPSPYGKHGTNERCYEFEFRTYGGGGQMRLAGTELVELAEWILQTFGVKS